MVEIMELNRPMRPTGVAFGVSAAVDILRLQKLLENSEPCRVERFLDHEEARTGKRPRCAMIHCPCKKCNPVRM